MADNYLERQRADYERRKAQWLRKKKHISVKPATIIGKPEDELL